MDPRLMIERLRKLDCLLAGEGAHIPSLAVAWSVSEKTVRRLIEAIRAQGLATRAVQQGLPRAEGTHYRHFYCDRRRRLFKRR